MEVSELEARERNLELIAQLEASGSLQEGPVADAFRAVLRHHFLPGRPLTEVYEDTALPTKVDERGVPVSSSSQPAIMALMLEQLHCRPGQAVLEIGAGTGYNAALLWHLVTPGGRVVTMDIDEDLCQQARAGLLQAGIEEVLVVCADGAGGWPAGAPYDRIVVTASVTDLSPAWVEQLAEGGRLVVPLALAGRVQQSVAFVRSGRSFFSDGLVSCGFLGVRGWLAAPAPEPDPELEAWLAEPGRPLGAVLTEEDPLEFESWLALTHPGYVRASLAGRPVFGLRDAGGVALVGAEEGSHVVAVHGAGEGAATRLAAAHREWTRRRPRLGRLRIDAFPAGSEPDLSRYRNVIRRPRFTFAVE